MPRTLQFALSLLVLVALAPAAAAQVTPDLETAREVYENLARQFQDGRVAPDLEMSSTARTVARFDAARDAIILEEQAYHVARAMGPDSLHALAYLLGHELAHFYGEHAQRYRFRELFRDLAAADTVAAGVGSGFKRQEMLQFETEADLKAGFAAYLAGYSPLPTAAAFLERVYSTYGLDAERISNHPSLADRVQLTAITADMLDRLIQLFEGGVHLMVIGRYEEAARVFDHLARAFPSRELLSNAGTARALHALDILGDEVAWSYPFELDVETRLDGTRRGIGFSGPEEAERLLREAQEYFERARLRDPEYLPAWVNLAAVHQLLEEPHFAAAYAEHALALAESLDEPAPRAHALVVRGIVRAGAGDENAARTDFQAAASAAPSFSAANLAVLDGGDAATAFASDERTRMFSTEAVASIPEAGATPRAALQAALQRMGEPDVQLELPAAGQAPEVGIYAERLPDAHVFAMGNPASGAVLVLATPEGYTGESAAGVRVGSALAEMRAAYGDAGQVIATRQGAYHVYDRAQIAFAVDAGQRVTGWLVWYVED